MFGIAVSTIVVISMVWVYLDASRHRIGKIAGKGGLLNMSAGAWGAATGFLWFVGFPAYLIRRSALIEIARTQPAESPARTIKALVFSAIALGGIGLNVLGYVQGTLPACDSAEVVNLTQKLIKDSPLIKLSGLEITGITMVGQKSYDTTQEKRLCRGMLTYALGTEGIEYTVEWADKAKGMIWVQIAGQ